jgi:hypothetical protein
VNFQSQDSYDVVKDGRFVGRIRITIYPGQDEVTFPLRQTFEEWRHTNQREVSMSELTICMRLVKFIFTDGSYTRIFDASGVPMEHLNRIPRFHPAY